MKAFPVEALAHSPLTAVLKIAIELDLWPEEVKSVEVETISRAVDILADPSKYRPTTRETADHSLPFCLASAIMDKKLTPNSFVPERLTNKRLYNLMDKITIKANPEFDSLFPEMQPSRVTIHTKDGRKMTHSVEYPKGDPRSPMSQDDLDLKFKSLTESYLPEENQLKIKQTVLKLETLSNISSLLNQCKSNHEPSE
jgi:2-methylcitrate dehydratase